MTRDITKVISEQQMKKLFMSSLKTSGKTAKFYDFLEKLYIIPIKGF